MSMGTFDGPGNHMSDLPDKDLLKYYIKNKRKQLERMYIEEKILKDDYDKNHDWDDPFVVEKLRLARELSAQRHQHQYIRERLESEIGSLKRLAEDLQHRLKVVEGINDKFATTNADLKKRIEKMNEFSRFEEMDI